MKSFLVKLSLLAAIANSVPCWANETTESSLRFGIFDMQKLILTVEDGKEARGALEKEIKTKEDEFRKKKEELDKLNKDWKDQAPLLSEDARMKKQQDFQEKFVELRNTEMAFQQQIKQKESQATQRIAVKAQSLVDGLARERNLEAVFEVNSSGLLYVKNPVDLTSQIIEKYNKVAKSEVKVTKPEGLIKEATKPTSKKSS